MISGTGECYQEICSPGREGEEGDAAEDYGDCAVTEGVGSWIWRRGRGLGFASRCSGLRVRSWCFERCVDGQYTYILTASFAVS